MKTVKPYGGSEREIDWELVDHGVDFMKRQKAAGNRSSFTYRFPARTFRICRRSASRAHHTSASSAIL